VKKKVRFDAVCSQLLEAGPSAYAPFSRVFLT